MNKFTLLVHVQKLAGYCKALQLFLFAYWLCHELFAWQIVKWAALMHGYTRILVHVWMNKPSFYEDIIWDTRISVIDIHIHTLILLAVIRFRTCKARQGPTRISPIHESMTPALANDNTLSKLRQSLNFQNCCHSYSHVLCSRIHLIWTPSQGHLVAKLPEDCKIKYHITSGNTILTCIHPYLYPFRVLLWCF